MQLAHRGCAIVGLHDGGNDRHGIGAGADGQGSITDMDTADGDNGQGHRSPDTTQLLQGGCHRILLGNGRKQTAETDIIGPLPLSLNGLFEIMGGYAYQRSGSEKIPGAGHRAVRLAEMHTVCLTGQRQLRVVVDDKQSLKLPAYSPQLTGLIEPALWVTG